MKTLILSVLFSVAFTPLFAQNRDSRPKFEIEWHTKVASVLAGLVGQEFDGQLADGTPIRIRLAPDGRTYRLLAETAPGAATSFFVNHRFSGDELAAQNMVSLSPLPQETAQIMVGRRDQLVLILDRKGQLQKAIVTLGRGKTSCDLSARALSALGLWPKPSSAK